MWALIVMWSPVLIDLVAVSHNATRTWDYFGTSKARGVGTRVGLALVARELALWGPFVRGGQTHEIGGVLGAPWWWLLVPAVAAGALLVGPLRAQPADRPRLAAAALLLVLMCAIGAALEGLLFDYLVTFMIAGAVAFWWAVLVAGTTRLAVRPVVGAWIGLAMVGGIIAFVAVSAVTDPARAELPEQSYRPIVKVTADRLAVRLGSAHGPVVVDYLEDDGGLVATGVIGVLATHYDLRTGDRARLAKWGYKRAQIPRGALHAYTLVVVYRGYAVSPPNRCVMQHAGHSLLDIGLFDHATQREFDKLRIDNYVAHGHLSRTTAARYSYLLPRSARVLVYDGFYRKACK
jgi:hypothetical protein